MPALNRRLEYSLLALIVAAYLVLAWGYAIHTPAWQVPDEPAHYNYVRQLAETGQFPVIEPGDWDQDYQTALVASGFPPDLTDNIAQVQYEDHQPPLYYLLQTPVYHLSGGDIEAMRLFSALVGLGVVFAVWAISRRLLPERPWIGIGAAAVVAFLPQRLAMMAGVNNDALAESLAGLVWWLVVVYLTRRPTSWRWTALLGLAVGLVFLTKTTVYYVSGIAGLAVLVRWRLERWSLRMGLSQVAALAIPALLLGSLWWGHSLDVYGGTDFLGLERHDEVVVGQPRTDDYIRDMYGGSLRVYLENLGRTTFHSFWGQFGWMAWPLPPRVYHIIQAGLGAALVGLGIGYARWGTWRRLEPSARWLMGLLGLGIGLVFVQFGLYNLSFVQFQGRYLYPALIPLALLVALGFSGWLVPLERRWPWSGWLAVVPPFLMLILAWYALTQVVMQQL